MLDRERNSRHIIAITIYMENTIALTSQYITKFYFTKVVLWLTVLVALYYSRKKDNTDHLYKILRVYLILELTLGLIDNLISPNPNINYEIKSYYINFSNSLIALSEFYFFSELYNRVFPSKYSYRLTRSLSTFLLCFFVAIISNSFFNGTKFLLELTYALGTIEFLFIFFLSLSYFISQIKIIPETNLFNRGSFWCFTGALFYCAISAPFYIIGPNFPTGNSTFDLLLPALLYYLPYSILFVFITISLKCKTQIWN
jgi:hypothetical protein